MKSYVRNTINLSCAKILLTSVIDRHFYNKFCDTLRMEAGCFSKTFLITCDSTRYHNAKKKKKKKRSKTVEVLMGRTLS